MKAFAKISLLGCVNLKTSNLLNLKMLFFLPYYCFIFLSFKTLIYNFRGLRIRGPFSSLFLRCFSFFFFYFLIKLIFNEFFWNSFILTRREISFSLLLLFNISFLCINVNAGWTLRILKIYLENYYSQMFLHRTPMVMLLFLTLWAFSLKICLIQD